jgi:hypothetical protein
VFLKKIREKKKKEKEALEVIERKIPEKYCSTEGKKEKERTYESNIRSYKHQGSEAKKG